jgi:hypothetical protein
VENLTKEMLDRAIKELYSAGVERPWVVVLHPRLWNGYWEIKNNFRLLRRLGRLLHNKYVYWLGFQVRWATGLKEILGYDFNYVLDEDAGQQILYVRQEKGENDVIKQ